MIVKQWQDPRVPEYLFGHRGQLMKEIVRGVESDWTAFAPLTPRPSPRRRRSAPLH